MMSTLIVVALFLGSLAGSLLLWVVFLRLGLRWAKIEGVTTGRIAAATVLVVVLNVAYAIVSHLVSRNSPEPNLDRVIIDLAAAVLIPCFAILQVFKTSSSQALRAGLPTLLSPAIMLAFVFLVFRPFLIEAYVVPTNSMAPTLLGNHCAGTCVECGSPACGSPIPGPLAAREKPWMICRDNFHVTQPTDNGDREFDGDRFLVAKYMKPRRWDLIVFRCPEDPSVSYVMRLVGLPGEELMIQDGQVLADGQVLTPPDSIKGINYVTEMPYWPEKVWGSPDHPAKLADDEYFVLGDFSQTSKDSRLWRLSASGHNPYAVPESHLLGVVTHIYWPPSRWRVFR